jgi:ElaB/YqjD/DUF883 family membrane-anchored ribosome-binding protein
MADINKLNLTPRPIYPEPSPTSAAVPETASPSTFDVGSGSEVRTPRETLRSLDASQRERGSEDASDKARVIAERARDKFQSVTDDARERMDDLAGRASDMAKQAGQRINDMRDRLNDRLPEWKEGARDRMNSARVRARSAAVQADAKARRMPLETIAVAAGAGFILGATMRVWRSSRG